MRNDFDSNYLMHHGILGMKWGHKNGPPYPLDAKSHSASEKKAGWMQSLKDKSEAKKKKKKQQAALEKARKTREAKAKEARLAKEYEEQKDKILKSGKASEVSKYKGQMSNKELSDAINRIKWERELDSLAEGETTSTFDRIDGIMKKVGTATDWVNKGVNAYTAVEKALKLFEEPEEEDRSFFERLVDKGDINEIKRYEKEMTAQEAKKAWENYNTRQRIRETQTAKDLEKQKKKKK